MEFGFRFQRTTFKTLDAALKLIMQLKPKGIV